MILEYLSRYKVQVLVILLLTIAEVWATVVTPAFISDLSGIALRHELTIDDINFTALCMLGVLAIFLVSAVLASYLTTRLMTSIGNDVRKDLFAKAKTATSADASKISEASMTVRLTNDVSNSVSFIGLFLRVMVTCPLTVAGCIIGIHREAAALNDITAVAAIVLCLTVIIVTTRIMVFYEQRLRALNDSIMATSMDAISGQRTIRSFFISKRMESNFDRPNRSIRDCSVSSTTTYTFNYSLIYIINHMMVVAAFILGSYLMMEHPAESIAIIGSLIAFTLYYGMILEAFLEITDAIVEYAVSKVSIRRIDEVLRMQAAVMDGEGKGHSGNDICFTGVTYSYPGSRRPSVRDVSFTVRDGSTVGIIGPTGSGKSTLLNMLVRLLDPDEGKVTLGGTDVRDMKLEQLRSEIAYVPQRPFIYSGTVRDNITVGNPRITDAMALEALEMMQCGDFIELSEKGLDTELTENGSNLSGGQKQRIALARALSRDPGILILDNPCSAMDTVTEKRVMDAIRSIKKDRTVVIVSQRMSSVRDADLIIVTDGGRVIDSGTHDELRSRSGLYREFWESHTGGTEA